MSIPKGDPTDQRRIVLIGCGGIGQYHLMALLKIGGVGRIDVVEPQPTCRDRARSIADQQRQSDTAVAISSELTETGLPPPAVTIVATQAAGRANLIRTLLFAGHRCLIVEKMVCQSEAEYESILAAVEETGARVWVNIPSRYNKFYSRFLTRVDGPVVMNVVGSGMGLGSNAIHFLDLYSRLRRDQSLRLSGDHLASTLLPNKRGEELVEFAGTLVGGDAGEGVISISNLGFEQPTQTISITSATFRIFVDELGKVAEWSTRSDGWNRNQFTYDESRVSEVTRAVVEDVLKTDDCLLPTIHGLAPLHAALFRVFREQVRRVTGSEPRLCPVT